MTIFKKISLDNKKLAENFISLSILQGANYILPLITVPYLVRVLGPEKFGLITFAQAFTQYFAILTDYGFNLSASRKISIFRDDKVKVSQVLSAVLFIKFVFMLTTFLALTLLVVSVPKFRTDWSIYLLTFATILGSIIFPVWFFQGMEKMKYITLLNVSAKLTFTVAIFIFVKDQSDYLYVPVINSFGFLVAGVLSLLIILKGFKVCLKIPSKYSVFEELKDGWHIFISTVAISLYTASNTFILGLFTSNSVVGYYSAGEKLIRAIPGILTPISQTIYPHMTNLAEQSKVKALKFIRKTLLAVGALSFIFSIFTFIFAETIVNVILGTQYTETILVVRILAFLPFIVALSNIFGVQTMLTFHLNKAFSKILILASILNITLALLLVPLYRHIGTAVSIIVTETFVTAVMFSYLEYRGISVLKGTVICSGRRETNV